MKNGILSRAQPQLIALLILVSLVLNCCSEKKKENAITDPIISPTDGVTFKSGFSDVNGIKLYYETYGKGQPLVLIHGGGSTIQSSFERVIPALAKNFHLIAIELQNHGRSDTRSAPETFEQDADDVAALLKNLGIAKANFLGFSNGGHTSFEIALRHPELVDRLIIASSPCNRSGFVPGFFESMPKATLANMPQELKTAFMKVNPDSARLQYMFEHDRDRMTNFKGWSDEQIKSITAPTLLICGDADVITPEHAVAMHGMIAHSRLAILPGGHGTYMGEVTTLSASDRFFDYLTPLVENFLTK